MSVRGTVLPRFRACREAVSLNLTDGLDLGCSLAVVKDGDIVVDLWGGYVDSACTRPWQDDTLVNIWSVTKGILALAIAISVERGQLRYGDPVARIWPEFAENGKDHVTLDLVMSHRAGLHAPGAPIRLQDIYDWHPCVEAFAAMAPLWPPASRCVYHAFSYGHIAGEALRRADGRMPGRFIAEEIAEPLGLDLHVGLGNDQDNRVAELIASRDVEDWIDEQKRTGYHNANLMPPITALTPNERAWRAADIPAANGHATARSLAVLYGLLSAGEDGLISAGGLRQATAKRFDGLDASLNEHCRFGAGFVLGGNGSPLGPNPASFGHNGWGGAFAFADPDAGLGVAYTMNRMLGRSADSMLRHGRMIEAVYGAI